MEHSGFVTAGEDFIEWLLSPPSPLVLVELPSVLSGYKYLAYQPDHRMIYFLYRLDKLPI